MRPCDLRNVYLDAGLPPDETTAFEKHLAVCRDCSDWVYEWRMFERGVNRWAKSRTVSPVTVSEAAALVERAEASRRRRGDGRYGRLSLVTVGMSVAAASAAVVMFMIFRTPEADSPQSRATPEIHAPVVQAVVSGLEETDVSVSVGAHLVAPSDRSVTAVIDKDRIALSSKGRMRLIRLDRGQVRLGLESGTVACRVDKRNAGEEFVVNAGDYSVRVVGTRFSVTRAPLGVQVVVQEGAVRVEEAGGERWLLHAGDLLTDSGGQPVVKRADSDALRRVDVLFESPRTTEGAEAAAMMTEEPAAPPPDEAFSPDRVTAPVPSEESVLEETTDLGFASVSSPAGKKKKEQIVADIPGWRKMVIDGRADDARREMRTYLKSSPNDSRVLALYADAARKSQSFQEAVRAYKKVIEIGDDANASRAMYMLGSLYQAPLAQHQKAVEMLQAYKKSGHVSHELSELTDVKIAKSLVALGKCRAAKQAIAHLLKQSGSFVVENARKMIESCDTAAASPQTE